MNIGELAASQVFRNKGPLDDFREAVVKQSVRHTRRRVGRDPVDIIQQQRPNESEKIQEYRAENERQFTRSGTEKFISKSSRIITQGLTFTNVEGKLKEYLDSRPFYDTGNRYGFEDFLFGVVFGLAIENPNLLAVAFPYNPLRPDIAPAALVTDGGLRDDERLGIAPKIVHPAFVDDDSFAFLGGQRKIQRSGQEVDVDFYYAADRDYWYTLEPSYVPVPQKGIQLIYTPQVWYRWDLGTSPVNYLPGVVAMTEHGKYRESFLRSYFAFADEAISAFSDNQAIRVRFAHPAVGMQEVECHNAGCRKGFVHDEAGERHKCPVCLGTNKVTHPGPFGTLIRPKGGMTETQTTGPLMEFYHPDVAILENSCGTWQDLFKLGKQEIGLDLLDGTGVESGRAKDLRLDDLHDLLSQIGLSIGTCGEQWLQQFEALLNPIVGDRVMPAAVLPASYKLLDATELKENAEEALFEDRYEARMEYYRHKYRGQPGLIRLYEIAMTYAPSMLLNDEEVSKRLAIGSITEDDLSRRDHAVPALHKLSRTGKIDLVRIDDEAAYEAIESYLVSRTIVVPRGSIEEIEDREKSPLLETVGGVTGIVAITQAVATGGMTEQAAEALLVEVFGFTPEKAAKLIEAPNNGSRPPQEEQSTGSRPGGLL